MASDKKLDRIIKALQKQFELPNPSQQDMCDILKIIKVDMAYTGITKEEFLLQLRDRVIKKRTFTSDIWSLLEFSLLFELTRMELLEKYQIPFEAIPAFDKALYEFMTRDQLMPEGLKGTFDSWIQNQKYGKPDGSPVVINYDHDYTQEYTEE